MRKRKAAWTTLLAAILAGWTGAGAFGEDDGKPGVPFPGVATLALFDKAPTVDGKIEKEEWRLATRTTGFLAGGNAPWGIKDPALGRFVLDARTGTTRVGYTRERLYIAISTEIPPDGTLFANQTGKDAVKTVFDSSIEVWLADMSDDAVQYQMIANSKGAIFDVRKSPEAPDVGWNGDWEFANTIDPKSNRWHAELSLPFADIGGKGDVVGQTVKAVIARNFKRPWNQITWFQQGSFKNPEGYVRLRLTRDEPVVQITRLGEYDGVNGGPLFDGPAIDMHMTIVNPGPARKALVDAKAYSTDMPSVEGAKTLDLPAGEAVDDRFELKEGLFQKHASNWLNVFLRPAGEGDPWFAYGMAWNRQGAEKVQTWNVNTDPKPHLAARVGYYPYYDLLKVKFDPAQLVEQDKGSTEARVVLTNASGETLFETTETWGEKDAPLEKTYEVDPLPEDTYTVTVTYDRSDEVLTKTFERKWFPWEGNMLGITDRVIPPFTPIEVEGQEVAVVLRRYTMTDLGFWSSIQARGQDADEDFKELLAAPIELVAGDTPLRGEGSFTETAPNHVVYEGTAEHPAVTVTTRNRIEEDGCMRVELTLAPGTEGAELPGLYLRIPLADAMCPLYHLSTTALRINPVGGTPEGTGKVWDSNDFPNGEWIKNFVPYLWFGAEARGLCWFADNDKGWVTHEDKKKETLPPQQLFRENGVLTLRLNLVQKPITLEKPRTLVFGLMASPGKPFRKDWRAFGRPEHRGILYTTGFRGKHVMQGKYPINGDWSFWDSLQARRLGYGEGKSQTGEYLKKLDRYFVKRNLEGWPEYAKKILTIRGGGGFGRNEAHITVYFDEYHSTSLFHEEAPTYYAEWSGRYPPDAFPEKAPEGEEHRNAFAKGYAVPTQGITPSYRDFACWYAAEWLRRGYGLYFDNSNPRTHYDPVTSSAYRLPDGRIQPSAGIWARRAYQKRIWTLHQDLFQPSTPQIMMLHITNTQIVPYMTWNESTLDLEWKRGPRPLQARFSHKLLRAETTSRQTGNIAKSFTKCQGTAQAQIASNLALMVHEVLPGIGTGVPYPQPMLEIGHGLEECRVVNYWDANAPLAVSDPECKWLLMQREGKTLVLLVTWNPEPAEVTLAFEPGALPGEASEAESFILGNGIDKKHRNRLHWNHCEAREKTTVPIRDNEIVVPMAGFGYRFVRIR